MRRTGNVVLSWVLAAALALSTVPAGALETPAKALAGDADAVEQTLPDMGDAVQAGLEAVDSDVDVFLADGGQAMGELAVEQEADDAGMPGEDLVFADTDAVAQASFEEEGAASLEPSSIEGVADEPVLEEEAAGDAADETPVSEAPEAGPADDPVDEAAGIVPEDTPVPEAGSTSGPVPDAGDAAQIPAATDPVEAAPAPTDAAIAPATVAFFATKAIEGVDYPNYDRPYSFEATLVDGPEGLPASVAGVSDPSGLVTFGTFDVAQPCAFVYRLKETRPEAWYYNSGEFFASVVVAAGSDNALHATVTYTDRDGAVVEAPRFSNTVKPRDGMTVMHVATTPGYEGVLRLVALPVDPISPMAAQSRSDGMGDDVAFAMLFDQASIEEMARMGVAVLDEQAGAYTIFYRLADEAQGSEAGLLVRVDVDASTFQATVTFIDPLQTYADVEALQPETIEAGALDEGAAGDLLDQPQPADGESGSAVEVEPFEADGSEAEAAETGVAEEDAIEEAAGESAAEEKAETAETPADEATQDKEDADKEEKAAAVAFEPVDLGADYRVSPSHGQEVIAELEALAESGTEESVALNAASVQTYAQAVAAVRSAMVARSATVTVTVDVPSSTDYRSYAHSLIKGAFQETGNPQEGGYLSRAWKGYRIGMTKVGTSRYTYEYTITYETTAAQERQLMSAVDSALASLGVSNVYTMYEKTRIIYNFICGRVTYGDPGTSSPQSAYAAMIDRTAVCEGVAQLAYLMLSKAGVPVRYISGYGKSDPHGWNIVQMDDGLWYNIDATWDLGEWEYWYEYFLKGDDSFPNHTRWQFDDVFEDTTSSSFYAAHPMGSGTYDPAYSWGAPWPVSQLTVGSVGDKTWTGSAIKPSPTVKFNGRTLKKGTDYTLSYSNNTKVGTAKITITGKGAFYGTRTVTFKIKAISLSGATATLARSVYYYTGKALKPAPTVKVGGKTLRAGTDYTVSYANNVKIGTATVTVTGKGGYGGTTKVTFKVLFSDTPASAWYVKDGWLAAVVNKGYMTGYGGTTRFGPDDPVTRGQVATVLWRASGSPSVSYSSKFKDVPRGQYYTTAVLWCAKQGIVTGYGNGIFKPDNNITREELATMLYRYAKYRGVSTYAGTTAYYRTGDTWAVSSWARTAMIWSTYRGVITGIESGGTYYLRPQQTATRAQMAKMITVIMRSVG